MKTRCEHCGQDYEVDESLTGAKAECGVCAKNFIITTIIDVPEDGDLILGLYLRKGEPFEGGMGKVFRVHHTTWNVDLAMKQPHAKNFKTEEDKQLFDHECEAWINLGLHPHIVSCYYVREIDGVPNIFAEWMDGGSLSHWIGSEKLYDGEEQEILKRILDIAIQFAWGLNYAHERGLIHQDVKPDNVLFTSDGMVKVADFGIANAKSGLGLSVSMTSQFNGTMVSDAGANTPAYCSPEQANSGNLTRRTDIWSWAVSLLEMLTGHDEEGHLFWDQGSVAGYCFEDYLERTVVPVPPPLMALLAHCFKENEAERPHNFKIIADKLLEIYRTETGKVYNRAEPKSAGDDPGSLNNRALSYMDRRKSAQAEQFWTQALKIDHSHLESTYNHGLHLWRSARIDDMELIRRLDAARLNINTWQADYLLANVHLERGDAESAMPLLKSAANQSNNDADVAKAMGIATKLLDVASGQCIRTFEGHTNDVSSVSFSPDGKYALSGGDKTMKLWAVASGQCLRTFEGHTNDVSSVSFSPDGKFALSGSWDKTLKLWDMASGQCIRTFEGHTNSVSSVSFSPDGKYAISGGLDNPLKLWDVASGQCIRTFGKHTRSFSSVGFSPDGKYAISGSNDKTLNLWDVASGQCLRTFEGHTGGVYSVSFSPDGKYALSGCYDKTLKLWAVASGLCLRTFEGHTHWVTSVSFSPDGKFALSGSSDHSLKLWDAASGQCLRTFEVHTEMVKSVSFSPDGKFALSAGRDRTLKLWDVPIFTGYADWVLCRIRTALETLDHEQRFVAAMENAEKKTAAGDFAAALTALADARSVPGFERSPQSLELNFKIGRSCRITGLQNGWLEHTLSDHTNRLFSVSISPDGNLALSGSEYGILKLWDMASGQCIRTFEGHTYNVTSVSFSPDGKYALSGCYDNTMKLWDVASGQCIRTFEGYTGVCDVSSVSFSPDGKFALSGSEDKTMKLWDVASGQCIRTCQGHTKKVTSVSFSPDGKLALSGSHDKTLKLWDVASGQCIRTFLMHIDFVNAVSFSPDGKFALSGSDDNTLKLWAVASGQCLRTFEGHISSVNSVSFSPDGKFALSGSSDHSLKLWDAASGQCLRTFDRHTKGVNSVSFSPDGRYALSGSYDGPLKLWRLDWNYEFPGWTDWDDGAEPYLHNFLTVRNGKWNDDDFKLLINNLQNRGYGWLKPEGVKRELEKMTAVWQDSIQDLFQNQPFIEPEIGMQFVYVEPGSFQMGSNDACVFYAKPVHSVTISNGYWLGKYEVTQEEYQSITGSNPSNFKGGRKPVDSVSWDDAVSFCQKLTERERSAGRLPSGYEYRLPTEAEWEYAARGGIASKGYQYSGSDNPDSVAWYDSNSGSTTHDVGTKSPNELGIYDMSGNVWEWCLDDWHSGYAGAPSDGSRWGDGTGSSRVFRGGGWDCLADLCREAFRFGGSPGDGSGGLGLRVALASSSK